MSCSFHPGGAIVADGYLVGFTTHEPEMIDVEDSPLKEIAKIVYAAKAARKNWPFNDDGTRWALHPPVGTDFDRFAMTHAVDYDALKALVRSTFQEAYSRGAREGSLTFLPEKHRLMKEISELKAKLAERDKSEESGS